MQKEKEISPSAPLPVACVIAAFIILFFVAVVKGSEIAFGIMSGWMTIFVLSLFMALEVPKGISWKGTLTCIAGCVYGVVCGIFFTVFTPLFVIGVFLLIAMKLSGKAAVVMNDYAFCMATVYTIAGVSNIQTIQTDAIMLGLGFVIVFIISAVYNKINDNDKSDWEAIYMQRVKLPEGSEKKSYYKFFHEPLIPVTDEEIRRYTTIPGNPAKALEFKDRARLLKPDFEPDPEGYFILPDGTVVISTAVETPHMTGEMLGWWMPWHQLDPLRYALWNPEDHYDIRITDETRKKLLDDSLPCHERIWNTTSYVNEAMNKEAPEPIDINFINPGEYGYDLSGYGSDSCMAMVASNGFLKKGPLNIPVFMTEVLRKSPGGKTTWYGHWWLGHAFRDGKEITQKIPLPLRKKVAQTAAMLIVHNHKEVRHLDKILPQIYAENKDNWLE